MKKAIFAVFGLSVLAGAAQAGVAYSSLLTSGITSYLANGGSTSLTSNTRMLLDDISVHPLDAGKTIKSITFGMVQNDPAAFRFRLRMRFYQDNAGLPGAYISGFSYNFGNVPQGVYNQTFNILADIPSSPVIIPASGKMWVGVTFDGSSTTAGTVPTVAQLNGLGIYSSPTATQGSSNSDTRRTDNPGSFVGIVPTPNSVLTTDNSKLGMAIEVVPEPATMAALGLGIAALARRKRK